MVHQYDQERLLSEYVKFLPLGTYHTVESTNTLTLFGVTSDNTYVRECYTRPLCISTGPGKIMSSKYLQSITL